MQVKDVDTLYSDYLKVRDILRGRSLYLNELENLCKKEGIDEEVIQTMRDLGQIKRRIREDGIPDNKMVLHKQDTSHYAAVGMDENAQFYEDYKLDHRLTLDNLLDIISQFYRESKRDIISPCRVKSLVICRQVFCFFSKSYIPNITLKKIGLFLGGRDHSTVINSLRNHENDMLYTKGYKEEFAKAKEFLINKL